MRRIISLVLAGVVVMAVGGCSKSANKDQATESKEATWERVGDADGVAFKVLAKNSIQTANGQSTPILYIGCGNITMLTVRLPEPLPKSTSWKAKVGIVLDGTNAHRQDWDEATDEHGDLFAPPSQEAQLHLLNQILEAKSLKLEFTPKGGTLQSAVFNVPGLKERFGHEPACKSWLDPSNYK